MARGDGTLWKYTIKIFPQSGEESIVEKVEGTNDWYGNGKLVIWEHDTVVYETNMEYTMRRELAR